jgi:hypothetical protein
LTYQEIEIRESPQRNGELREVYLVWVHDPRRGITEKAFCVVVRPVSSLLVRAFITAYPLDSQEDVLKIRKAGKKPHPGSSSGKV